MNTIYDERHERTAKKLRIIGIILILLGIALVATGVIHIVIVILGDGFFPFLSFLIFLGFPCIFAGSCCLGAGYHKKMLEYGASQTMPVMKDVTNYMLDETADSTANFAGKVSSSIAKSFKNAKNDDGIKDNDKEGIYCPSCGVFNEKGSNFCEKCGERLPVRNTLDDYSFDDDDYYNY